MKASNIYQTLKSRAKASTTAKPQLPGIGSPLNLNDGKSKTPNEKSPASMKSPAKKKSCG